MFKMIVNCTQSFESEVEALDFYEEIRGELQRHPNVNIAGRIVKKFAGYDPEHPEESEPES